jgi:hypothetical protein
MTELDILAAEPLDIATRLCRIGNAELSVSASAPARGNRQQPE